MRKLLLSLLVTSAVIAAPATAQRRGAAQPAPASEEEKTPTGEKHKDMMSEDAARGWARGSIDEKSSVTQHSINLPSGKMDYTATAGTLTVRDNAGKPTGSYFYVAYTANGANKKQRPVTFMYNGGPGSASAWLHMGSFAPVRVTTGNPETIRPAPYGFGPNMDTLLDKSDLIFIDAMGTGFSRAVGDAKEKDFWGVDQDVDGFARVIMRYLSKNGRWISPKFIFGESYGTTRSGALSYALQQRGVALNGVVLLSSILNYGVRQPGFDNVYLTYLPSYAATAWYHNRIQNRPPQLKPFLDEVRAFTYGPYAAALAKGSNISVQERDAIAQKMSQYTGLSVRYLIDANLRVDLGRFRKELLRDQRLTVGRLDSRYVGIDSDAAGESAEYDSSDTANTGAFVSLFNDYVSQQLGFKSDMTYNLTASRLPGWEWDFRHQLPGQRGYGRASGSPDVAPDLAATMRLNPYLKLLSLNGYYDMATPFAGTEFDISHMLLEPAQQKNVSFKYYESGHMAYLNPAVLHQMHTDLARYYDETMAAARSSTPPAPVVSARNPNNP